MEQPKITLDKFVPRLRRPEIKHGLSKHKDYKMWVGLFTRCNNPRVKIYKYYGGKGVKVCERWNNFSLFLEDMGDRPEGLQLDRINNNGDYEKSNCRWVTPKENNAGNKGDLPDDMPGKRYGKWLVMGRVYHKQGHRYYECLCDCGTIRIICGGDLRRGNTTRCMKCKNLEHGDKHRGWSDRKRSS